MRKWGIIRIIDGPLAVLDKDGSKFSPNLEDAMLFDTEAEASNKAQTIMTPTLVQELEIPDRYDGIEFPPPDFFESEEPLMTLAELLDLIRQEERTLNFDPVDKITGANQMTGSGILDPFHGRLVGREFQFSFARMLSDIDVQALYNLVSRTDSWTSVDYVRKRLGFTGYAVLTLRSKNK